jgi:hypothetical protein
MKFDSKKFEFKPKYIFIVKSHFKFKIKFKPFSKQELGIRFQKFKFKPKRFKIN